MKLPQDAFGEGLLYQLCPQDFRGPDLRRQPCLRLRVLPALLPLLSPVESQEVQEGQPCPEGGEGGLRHLPQYPGKASSPFVKTTKYWGSLVKSHYTCKESLQ